jgi:AraC-like DNA-binding protein
MRGEAEAAHVFLDAPLVVEVRNARLLVKATRLLRDRGRKLLEVANSVGYDSDAAFNRAFKRMHGVSAGEYRRTIAAA